MAFFPLDYVLRGFPAAAYIQYASPQTLVRSCPAKKIHIYELDTQQCNQIIADGYYLFRFLVSFKISIMHSPSPAEPFDPVEFFIRK